MQRQPGPAIEARQLSRTFGVVWALRPLDFRIEAGTRVAVLGPNGAGKSTLLRVLSTLLRPSGGAARLCGHDVVREAASVRRLVGVVGHAPLVDPDLTAEENLAFYARMYRLEAAKARIEDLLLRVGLWHRRMDAVRTFSRGMQQRLALARALLHDPPVLLLDEPESGLDPSGRRLLEGLIADERGRTVVVTSHQVAWVLGLVDRVLMLDDGRKVYDGPADGVDRAALDHLAVRERSS